MGYIRTKNQLINILIKVLGRLQFDVSLSELGIKDLQSLTSKEELEFISILLFEK